MPSGLRSGVVVSRGTPSCLRFGRPSCCTVGLRHVRCAVRRRGAGARHRRLLAGPRRRRSVAARPVRRASSMALALSSATGWSSCTRPIASAAGPSIFFAAQDHVERVGSSDGASQPGGPTPRGDGPEIQLRQPNACALGRREAEMARERDLESAAEAVAEHRRNDRLVELLDQGQHPEPLIEDRLESTALVCAGHELLEVHPDAEVLLARCGEHDRTSVAIIPQPEDGALELVHVLERHPVSRRILIFEDHDPASTLDPQCRLDHRIPQSRPSARPCMIADDATTRGSNDRSSKAPRRDRCAEATCDPSRFLQHYRKLSKSSRVKRANAASKHPLRSGIVARSPRTSETGGRDAGHEVNPGTNAPPSKNANAPRRIPEASLRPSGDPLRDHGRRARPSPGRDGSPHARDVAPVAPAASGGVRIGGAGW